MRVHFIGIGGIGISAIARIMQTKGHEISGSDNCPGELTKKLEESGIKVFKKHSKNNVDKSIDMIAYSPAIPKENPELKKAEELGIKTMSYSSALGELSKEMYTIAVAGTHGKSTTTALSALILEKGGLDPTLVIGTKMPEFNHDNFKVGKSNYLVIEACEYKRTFLELSPDILIITNIEADHLDYYKDEEDYKNAFKELVSRMPEDGTIIINADDENSREVANNAPCQVASWSKSEKFDYKLDKNLLKFNKAKELDNISITIEPGVPGEFNRENAVFAAIMGFSLEIDNKKIESAIKNFKGTWRRMEIKKTIYKNKIFIDDYAHHPTEIALTLKAIKNTYPNKKILLIYQPHQYSRTKYLLKDFGKAFTSADKVIISNIYEVRDKKEDINAVSVKDLVNEIIINGTKAKNGEGLKKTAEYIKKSIEKYDLIITMGAGNIDKIYKFL